MKDLIESITKLQKKLKDNFLSLSEKKKILLIFLVILFARMIFFTLNNYTNYIQKIKDIEKIESIILNLKQVPLFLVFTLLIILISIVYILLYSKKDILPLDIMDITALPRPDASSNYYEITLTNPTNKRIFLKTLRVSWIYCKGSCHSIGKGMAINSIADYILDIPLDVRKTDVQTMSIKMDPMIEFPSSDEYGPSYTQFRVQIHYHFIENIKIHPCSDWDILFSLDVLDNDNRSFNIFTNYKWRSKEEIEATMNGDLDEYNEKLKADYIYFRN